MPPLMAAAFAALVGLVVFAALNRGGLGGTARSAVGGTLAESGGEKSIILAYLRENAGEPDSVEIIRCERLTTAENGGAFPNAWDIKFRETNPFGGKSVRSLVACVVDGEIHVVDDDFGRALRAEAKQRRRHGR